MSTQCSLEWLWLDTAFRASGLTLALSGRAVSRPKGDGLQSPAAVSAANGNPARGKAASADRRETGCSPLQQRAQRVATRRHSKALTR